MHLKNIIVFSLLIFVFLLFAFDLIETNNSIKIIISNSLSEKVHKYWVGGKYKIQIKKLYPYLSDKIFFQISNTNKVELSDGYLLMKACGRECLTAYTKKMNSIFCFNIYNTPNLIFKHNNPMRLEINNAKQLNLYRDDYPLSNIIFKSNHPDIIDVDKNGKITALRPGNAIITASGLDNQKTQIKVIATSKKGLINNYIMNIHKADQYNKIMIVAHPDDETLWGGANLIKDKYFVICMTNGYNLERANNFREILKYSNNSGIILDYPDASDNIKDNWSEVYHGIIKDLTTIFKYKKWHKIVTHGPEGTTGHIHHKKISKFVTEIAKKFNQFDNLFYFGKFYKKNEIPKYLHKISNIELEYKKKMVEIHKHEKIFIYHQWFHMLPYENWISASKWKNL